MFQSHRIYSVCTRDFVILHERELSHKHLLFGCISFLSYITPRRFAEAYNQVFWLLPVWPHDMRGCVINWFPRRGFYSPKKSYFHLICQLGVIWRGLDGNQSKVQPDKIARIARIAGEIKRQEPKSRNLASRVHFLPFCPIEISHCGQTKHRWQQHWKYRNTKNIAKNPKYLKSILWPFQGQGWAMSILW